MRNAVLIEATIPANATEVYIVDVEWWIGENEIEFALAVDKVFVVAVSFLEFTAQSVYREVHFG